MDSLPIAFRSRAGFPREFLSLRPLRQVLGGQTTARALLPAGVCTGFRRGPKRHVGFCIV